MARRLEVTSIQQPFRGMVWWRPLRVASSLLLGNQTDLGDPDISLVPDKVDLDLGDWVTLDANKDAVKAATPTLLAWAVWADGDRFDVRAGETISVLFGLYTARSAGIDAGLVGGIGTLLTTRNNVLDDAASGEAVVAVAEGAKEAGTTAYPDGFVSYNTLVGAHAP